MTDPLDNLNETERKLAALDMQYTVERWFRMYGYGETVVLLPVVIDKVYRAIEQQEETDEP